MYYKDGKITEKPSEYMSQFSFSECTLAKSAATCTEAAVYYKSCICGETSTETFTSGTALGHTWVNATCTAPKTCSVCNATAGEANGHTWADATCTAPKTCSVCKVTEDEALGHSYPNAWEKFDAKQHKHTCTRCGIEVEYQDHDWAGKTCTVCGYTKSSGTTTYALTFDTNGGSAISSIIGTYGKVIDLGEYVPAKGGYVFGGWYSDKALTVPVSEIKLTGDKTVYAKWTEKTARASEFPFIDVDHSMWSYGDIYYVWEKDLMNGITDTLFAPETTTSRAMIVTILHRLEGEPIVNYAMSFNDVVPDEWYTEAIRWAQSNGIAGGYSAEQFGPDDLITREQMMVILYRYAQLKGYDVSVDENTNFLSYNDFWDVGEYAMPAMMWAIENGLIQGGDSGDLLPVGSATREQVAAILHRFCEKYIG